LGLEVFRSCTNGRKSALQASSEQHVRAVLSRFASLSVPSYNHNHILVLERLARFLLLLSIQGVFEVEAFLLTCDSMRCSKEF
jgi:hypothetical protein